MQVTGVVFKVLPEQTGTSKNGNAWSKIDFVIETLDQYPKKVCVSAMGEKLIPLIKTLKSGEKITAHINLESREYNEKWYSNISAWKIDREANAQASEPVSAPVPTTETSEDDLPF